MLIDYPGTLLLASHDREFLDRVVTESLVLLGDGRIERHLGGYSAWRRHLAEQASVPALPAATPVSTASREVRRGARLSYKYARELEQLPARVEALEARMAELAAQLNDPELYRRDADQAARITADVAELQRQIDTAYARWAELDAMSR